MIEFKLSNAKRLLGFLAVAFAVALWHREFRQDHLILDGKVYDRSATVLAFPDGLPREIGKLRHFPNLRWIDLRGTGLNPKELALLQNAAGDARILWELAFQGGSISGDASAVQVRRLTDGDVEALCALPRLRRVDGKHCRDYAQLLSLAAKRPECNVEYSLSLGEICISGQAEEIAPGECTGAQIRNAMGLLPNLRQLDLRRTGITGKQARQMASDYPGISFIWEEKWGDVIFSTDVQELDLSGIPMDGTEKIEELIHYLPHLRKLILCDCGLSSKTMATLTQRYPMIRFVWRVKLGSLSARTDDTWFAPITHGQLIGGSDADELKYCTDMECIDLGHCWIRHCNWAQNMPRLRYLVLADTQVRDISPLAGLKKLCYLELFVTPVRDYSPLLGCSGLEDLNLGYTYGDPTPIAQMTWLKNLWWGGIHHVPWVGGQNPAAMVQHGLPDTRIALYAGSSTGMGWRELAHYYEMRDRIGMYYMKG